MKRITVLFLFILGIALVSWNFWKRDPQNVSQDLSQSNTSMRPISNDSEKVKTHEVSIADTKIPSSDKQNQFNHFIKSLPIIDDLQNLSPEEVHHTPEIIKDGGELIGRIHAEADSDATKRVDAMSFFKKCAEDEQIVTAIRAVCLNKIYKLVPVWKIPTPLSDSRISKDVLKLSHKIP